MKAPRVQCSCGLEIGEGNKRHLVSILHKRGSEIREMLAKNCNSLSEIGRTIGVSRERVRQMAELLGYGPGNTRRRYRRVSTKIQDCAVEPFYEQLKALRLPVKPFSTSNAFRYYISEKPFLVNGRLCFFGIADKNRGEGGRYISVMAPRHPDFEFAIFSYGDGFFVFPAEKIGREKQHTFLPPDAEILGTGRKSDAQDWNNYWNAWHLLKGGPR